METTITVVVALLSSVATTVLLGAAIAAPTSTAIATTALGAAVAIPSLILAGARIREATRRLARRVAKKLLEEGSE